MAISRPLSVAFVLRKSPGLHSSEIQIRFNFSLHSGQIPWLKRTFAWPVCSFPRGASSSIVRDFFAIAGRGQEALQGLSEKSLPADRSAKADCKLDDPRPTCTRARNSPWSNGLVT